MVATILISTLLVQPRFDAWDLKPNFETGKKQSWKITVATTVNGSDVEASFVHSVTPAEAKSDGTRKFAINWDNIVVNGADNPSPEQMEVTVGADGTVQQALTPNDDDYRRSLSIFAFVYPSKPVSVGDTYTSEPAPPSGAKKMKYEFTAAEATKVGEVDVLKFTGKQTEEGSDGITSEGTWYVAKDGSVVKYKLKVKNWFVPFAGTGPMEATITGEKQ